MLTINDTVEVKIGDKTLSGPVSYQAPETSEDVLTLLSADAPSVISSLRYAINLKARATVRQTLVTQEGGPEKAFEKSVKDIMKSRAAVGKPVTEEKARALAQMLADAE